MKKTGLLIDTAVFLLVLLWVYAASSKLLDFHHFKAQMHNQTVPRLVADLLIWTLPVTELAAAACLLMPGSKKFGFYLSAILMGIFTAYIGLVITGTFGRIPCSCGGVLGSLGWKLHFVFNLLYLLLTVLGIYHLNRERRITQAPI